jgi:hypothetical protein
MIDPADLDAIAAAVRDVQRARQAFIDQNVAGWPLQVLGYSHIDMAKVVLAEAVLRAVGYPDDPGHDEIAAIAMRAEAARAAERRMPPPWLRALIFARDGHVCPECGATERLSIDHIVPFARGGRTIESNLRVLCRPCNSAKGARV